MIDYQPTFTAVAHLLGQGWRYDARGETEIKRTHRLFLPMGAAITLFYDKGRFHIRGCYPEDEGRPTYARYWLSQDEVTNDPAITVSAARSPLDIAGEIRRRVLPYYLPLYDLCVQRKNASRQEKEKAQHMIGVAASLLGVECDRRGAFYDRANPHIRVYNSLGMLPSGEVSFCAYSQRFKITLDDIHPDCALAMLGVVQRFYAQRQQHAEADHGTD